MSMKSYLRIVLIIAVLIIGALGWQWLAADPGYLQLRIRGYVIETSAIVAVAILMLGLLVLGVALWLLRAPLRWLAGRRSRRSRHAFVQGELRLREGHWQKAEKLFQRAAEDSDFRIPALLEAAQAAHARGDAMAAQAYLVQLDGDPEGQRLAELERARTALAEDRPDQALALLGELGALPPAGLLLRVQALLASHRAEEALGHLPELHRAQLLDGLGYAKLELAAILQALAEAADHPSLMRVWDALPRGQKRSDPVVQAYVERARALGGTDVAALIEAQLKQEWNEQLVRIYGRLEQPTPARRLKSAEAWLAGRADSMGLNIALAQLYLQQGEFSRAEEFLGHALALDSDTQAWELLAEVSQRQQQTERARIALVNALRSQRNEAPLPLPAGSGRTAHLGLFAVAEERSEHGVPRLPGAGAH